MIHNTIISAPGDLRYSLRQMTRMQLARTLAVSRPNPSDFRSLISAYRISLRSLARRYMELNDEVADLGVMIIAIVDELAPQLATRNSIGDGSAAQPLLAAGDNPERLRSDAGFTVLCGVSPVTASSGKPVRHRLNCIANSTLHVIVIERLRTDPRTKGYCASLFVGKPPRSY